MKKKYKLTDEATNHLGRTLYRIEAICDFGDVKAGDKGGFLESERNLSQAGNCWVYDNAMVYDNATVYESVCNQCASCRRYRAHIDAVKLKLEYVCYIAVPEGATPLHCPEYWSVKGGAL